MYFPLAWSIALRGEGFAFYYMTYSEKLRSPKWQKKRLEILKRDKWACKKCKDEETELHVHHLEYHKNPWDTPNKLLVTLCKDCHQYIEDLKEENSYDLKKHKAINNSLINYLRMFHLMKSK